VNAEAQPQAIATDGIGFLGGCIGVRQFTGVPRMRYVILKGF
jgi:hypothetical protein